MVDIKPFAGLRFNNEKVSNFSAVIAPPYDIIPGQLKETLKKSSPFNIVNLTLPDENTEASDRYLNAKIILDKWIDDNILVFDSKNCFYLLEEGFIENGVLKSFTGFIGLLKVEQYGKGKVLRHEKTLSKPKEDRLKLLTACRTNFEFIYTIYNDSGNGFTPLIENIKKGDTLLCTEALYDKTLKFKLWKISDDNIIKEIVDKMKTKTLLIADGHHRYETSRLYREESLIKNSNADADVAGANTAGMAHLPEDYVLCLFVSSGQKDIAIHPTHRLIRFNEELKPAELKEKIGKYFDIEPLEASADEINKKMSAAKEAKQKSICICLKSGECYFTVLKKDLETIYDESGISAQNFNDMFEYLDVNILHKLLLAVLFKDYSMQDIKFVHTTGEVFENLNDPAEPYHAGFILNAPGIDTVEKLSLEEMIMPQKSTYFFPKPCSGLVLYKFEK
ncbi:MAG: DUF1015 domain-containing protein [Actinobacteria bacterium]|nr:DUF1015 domain-containing protein [Actinomycetota bacterium]